MIYDIADMREEVLRILKEDCYRKGEYKLSSGKMTATAHVSGALYKNALEGNVQAQIFWLKAQAGWREADRLEITGANGKELLTDTEREQRLASILSSLSTKKPIDVVSSPPIKQLKN